MPNECRVYDNFPELGGRLIRVWTKAELTDRADKMLKNGYKNYSGNTGGNNGKGKKKPPTLPSDL